MDPFADLLVFDAVQGLNSTLQAAALLNLPQSSISRRYRQFAQGLKLQLSRQAGSYQVVQGQCILQQMRQLAQRFRFLHHLNRWTVHPALAAWVHQATQELPGQWLPLPQQHWDRWLNQQLLDQVLDCRLGNHSAITNQPDAIHLALVADPAAAQAKTLVLGDWSTVDGLEAALKASGWRVASSASQQESLRALPARSPLSQAHTVAELVLHWRYGAMLDELDPLADTQRQQFERLMAVALGSGAGAAAPRPLEISELDFSSLSLD